MSRMLTYEQFVKTIDQLEEAQLLLAALELDIFTHIDGERLTAKQIAKKAKMDATAAEALLNCLVTLKALKLKEGRYANTQEMRKHFCKTSPDYKKGTVMLRQENYEEYGNLIRVIKKGRNFTGKHQPDNPKRRALFTHAMHERSLSRAGVVAEKVCRKPVGKLLDLGAGPGTYSACILKRDKEASAVLLDRASALKTAKEIWGGKPVWKRIDTRPGDLFDTDFGTGFDTVLFSNILHIYNPAENLKLLRKMHRALNPGGRLVLLDYFLKDDRTQPLQASMFSLTMLLFTETGKTYTWKETEELLKKAGFSKPQRIPLPDDSGLLTGCKK